MNVRRRRVVAGAFAFMLAACTAAPQRDGGEAIPPADDTPFDIAGRLSARQGSQGAAANFRWSHRIDRDSLTFASPLGSTLASLEGTPEGVRLTYPDGRTKEAPDWEALTQATLGAAIPVRGLVWWVRGTPHGRSAFRAENDAAGRIAVLQQDQWDITYAYAEGSRMPSRLTLSFADTEVRLVIDRWDDTQ